MKGIVLAGGTGSRLFPVTLGVSKQLLPIGDKPLIYYSISVLMLAGIRDIILVCNREDKSSYFKLFGDGSIFGISVTYIIQPRPDGIAQAFILAEGYIKDHSMALILGDNLFYGYGFTEILKNVANEEIGATIFGYRVKDPERFGVVELDDAGSPVSIEEKPSRPNSNIAITGLYFYDSEVVEIAKTLVPSHRGELEISDINKAYMKRRKLKVRILGRGFAWLDTGTHKAMTSATNFVNAIEERQGVKIACLEEIAFRNGWIDSKVLKLRIKAHANSDYGQYLENLLINEDY